MLDKQKETTQVLSPNQAIDKILSGEQTTDPRFITNLKGVTVNEWLHLDKKTIPGPFLNLKGIIIKGAISLHRATIEGNFNLEEAVIESETDLIEAVVKGHLFFRKATFKGNVFLGNAVIEGGLFLDEAILEGALDLQGAVIKGSISLATRKGPSKIYVYRDMAELVHWAAPTIPLVMGKEVREFKGEDLTFLNLKPR